MQCPKCGKNNLPNAQFCENCGQDLTAVQQNLIQPLPPKKSNAGKYILGVFIGLFLSLVAVGAIIVGHNYLAKRPVKSEHKLKESTFTKKDLEKAQAESLAREEGDTSENEETSSAEAKESSSSSETVSKDAPVPVLANGQTTTWVGNNGSPTLTINGTTSITISGASQAPRAGTYTIENITNNGEHFFAMNGPIVAGEIDIVGNTLTVNNQGQITTYHYVPEQRSDSSASETSAEGSSSDNFYEAD